PPCALPWSRQMSSPAWTCRPAGAVAPVRLKLNPTLIGSAARAGTNEITTAMLPTMHARFTRCRALREIMKRPPVRLTALPARRAPLSVCSIGRPPREDDVGRLVAEAGVRKAAPSHRAPADDPRDAPCC